MVSSFPSACGPRALLLPSCTPVVPVHPCAPRAQPAELTECGVAEVQTALSATRELLLRVPRIINLGWPLQGTTMMVG